jgi:hypothetical protein
LIGGKRQPIQRSYDLNKIYLPSHKASRKKKTEDEPVEDEAVTETYVEDDIVEETTED